MDNFQIPDTPPDHPLRGTFVQDEAGVVGQFDLSDQAYLLVVAWRPDGSLELVHQSDRVWDKAELAAGDGSYRVSEPQGSRLLLASAATPFTRSDLLTEAQASADPLDMLARTLPKAWEGVDVLVQSPPEPLP